MKTIKFVARLVIGISVISVIGTLLGEWSADALVGEKDE